MTAVKKALAVARCGRSFVARSHLDDLLTLGGAVALVNWLRFSVYGDFTTSAIFAVLGSIALGLRGAMDRIERKLETYRGGPP